MIQFKWKDKLKLLREEFYTEKPVTVEEVAKAIGLTEKKYEFTEMSAKELTAEQFCNLCAFYDIDYANMVEYLSGGSLAQLILDSKSK